MKRLDRGHLHPLLEQPETDMSRPRLNLTSAVGGEYSSKELFEQCINSYKYEPATWLLPVHVVT